MIVIDDSVSIDWVINKTIHFFRHESCGKCTPCREGGDWIYKILTRIENGEGTMADINLIASVAGNIAGKTLCPFGDALAAPALTTVKNFRAEFEAHVREGRCPLPADWRASKAPVGAH